MRIAIVEDESKVAQRVERLTREILGDKVKCIHQCSTLASGISVIESQLLDLVLLDLNMNGESGFELLENYVSRSFQTIIISANADLAIEAFEYGVLDFVPKPFTRDRLSKAFDRLDQASESDKPDMRQLAFRVGTKIVLKRIDEVLYIKGADAYSEIHFKDGSKKLHDKSLLKLESLLPARFARVHNSFIVDLEIVKELAVAPNHKYSLRVRENEFIPIGRSRYQEIKARLL